ncbi:MAG: chromosomal replication initiator protein DnaA [Prevotellaceae bacterium]|jgi:chromosomal replication initiator protein|nr:chromosomal replication initiator protein DnaA [Prevotellaceae bacterium]
MEEYQETASEHIRMWSKCLGIIKDIVPEAAFSTWFQPIVPQKWENNTITIQVPSMFFYEYLEEKYFDLLKATLTRVMGKGTKLKYTVLMENTSKTTVNNDGGRISQVSANARFDPFSVQNRQKIDSQLNPNYTFESFIEGSCNKLARAAGLAIAREPGKTAFNPIFIFGESGLGKTHLIHAIGLMTEEFHPEKNILYVNANKFQIQYTDAVRNNTVNDFLNFYQMLDVLILDDIQDFAGKTGTQNTFFHIFNHLHQSGKQLVLTSDREPKLLQGLDQRILSRFKWGLHAELEIPDFQTRKTILLNKVNADGLVIPENVVNYIAETVKENVRELEGVIVSLLAQSTLTNAEINIELAQKVVGKSVNITEKAISIISIQEAVCKYYNLTIKDIQTKSRKREVVQARQIAMYLARKHTKNSLSSIGEQIGNRDHATVLHACKTITDLLDIDKGMKQSLDTIESALR